MADGNISNVEEWLTYADKDMGVAEHLLATYHPVPVEIVCYHAQQASEKAIKAVIASMTNDANAIPKTHNLFAMLNDVERMIASEIDAKYRDAADVLTPYATMTHYPDAAAPRDLNVDDANAAVAMAKELVAWSKAVIGARSKNE